MAAKKQQVETDPATVLINALMPVLIPRIDDTIRLHTENVQAQTALFKRMESVIGFFESERREQKARDEAARATRKARNK